jgi:hypothetical protein
MSGEHDTGAEARAGVRIFQAFHAGPEELAHLLIRLGARRIGSMKDVLGADAAGNGGPLPTGAALRSRRVTRAREP